MSVPEHTEDGLRQIGYVCRRDDGQGWFILDTPSRRGVYASHNEASLWAVARRLERARMIA